MWSALFGSASVGDLGILVLQPDATARKAVAGFRGGAELRVTGTAPNMTVTDLLAKLNKYRGPDQQLKRIWGEGGEEIVGSTVVRGEVKAIVRDMSIA